jgi:hypothetical protein
MKRLLAWWANALVLSLAAEATVTAADAVGALLGLGHPAEALRATIGGVALLLSGGMGLVLSLTPLVPWRPTAAAALFPGMAALLAPIPLLCAFGLSPLAPLPVAGVEALIAVDAALAIWRRTGRWWLDETDMVGPTFTWRHALLGGFWIGVAPVVVSAVALALEVVQAVDFATQGYLQIRSNGLHLAQHDWYRDGQCVRLVGMMHIGDSGYYEGLNNDIAEPGAVVLEEGVTDPGKRIAGRLKYKAVAEALSLDTQARFEPAASGIEVRNADVSTEGFADSTVALLRTVGDLYSGESDVLADTAALEAMSTPEATQALLHDVFDARNTHLIREIQAALYTHDVVVVPWGAMHMPVIEAALKAEGFELGGRRSRVVIAW